MDKKKEDFKQFVQKSSFYSTDGEKNERGFNFAMRSKLSDYVMDFVVDKIVAGEYLPASRIDPKEIAQALDISQMPIRDALEKLEERGWIVKYPQRGTFIRKVLNSDLAEMYQVRMMIETEAIRHIIENYNPLIVDKLNEIVNKNEQAIVEKDLEAYEKYDTLFHRSIVAATENKRIISLAQTVFSQSRYYFLVLIWNSLAVRKHDIMDLRNIPISHKSMFEAIEAKDVNAAIEMVREHISMGLERYWQIAKILKIDDNVR